MIVEEHKNADSLQEAADTIAHVNPARMSLGPAREDSREIEMAGIS